jgi:predicted nuclease of restriction endonuclease-like (RecB) superfamily
MDIVIKSDKTYIEFIRDIKQRIQAAQIKASVAVNHEFLDIEGFSITNIKYMWLWFLFWYTETIGQQVVAQLGQIPWGHNLVII